jgi:Xaa-Pro aminopeptidase
MTISYQKGPSISLKERDRRYAAIRKQLREKNVDCVIVNGSNLFYLTNGLTGELFGLLTSEDRPLTVVINWRHLADLSSQVLADSQEWVKDFLQGIDARPLIAKIKELRLENGTIGLAGPISYKFYSQLSSALPTAKIVDVSDVFANVRTIKSEEEVALIDKANMIFDAAVERVHEVARPGMLGRDVVQEGIKAMWEAGGDMDSSFQFVFGAIPKQNPILAGFCLTRPIKEGDVGIMTAHSEFHHYAGHSDQIICFGSPKPVYSKMFDACLQVREAVLRRIKDGATQRDLYDDYEKACAEAGFETSEHAQMHQYGIDVPEFPGPQFKVADPKGGKGLGSGGNFVLKSGMVYSISPTVVANGGEEAVLSGTSLVVTENGQRELGNRKLELLVVS